MLDYQSLNETEGFILFINFFEAFDTIEHTFLIRMLEKFGVGIKFCKVIKMFYNNIINYISLNPGLTPRIKIN